VADETLYRATSAFDALLAGPPRMQAQQLAIEDVAVVQPSWVIVRNLIADDIAGVVSNAKNVHRTRWMSRLD